MALLRATTHRKDLTTLTDIFVLEILSYVLPGKFDR